MKNKYLAIGVLILSLFFINSNVYAEPDTCTSAEKKALKQQAVNMKFEYILIDEEGNYGSGEYYYEVYTLNYNENLKLHVRYTTYDYYSPYKKDGELLITAVYAMGAKETVEIYGSDKSKCKDVLLTTKTITVPYFNGYSKREECQGYQSYKVCNPNANVPVMTETAFKKEIEKIKKAEEEKKREEEEKNKPKEVEEQTTFDKIKEFYEENSTIVIAASIGILTLIIVIVIYLTSRSRNRIKVEIGKDLDKKIDVGDNGFFHKTEHHKKGITKVEYDKEKHHEISKEKTDFLLKNQNSSNDENKK